MRVILASASPARLATLRRAGLDPDVVVSEVDETGLQAEVTEPAALTSALARLKAEAVWRRLGAPPATIVIGCDSVLDFEGRAVGKPHTFDAAVALWRRLRGRAGVLVTGHHVIVSNGAPADAQQDTRVAKTVVHFADLADTEIDAYVATGEPQEVAGGFTIDGLGGPFIAAIEGDHHNVVGLSLPLLRLMLADLGVGWPSLWRV